PSPPTCRPAPVVRSRPPRVFVGLWQGTQRCRSTGATRSWKRVPSSARAGTPPRPPAAVTTTTTAPERAFPMAILAAPSAGLGGLRIQLGRAGPLLNLGYPLASGLAPSVLVLQRALVSSSPCKKGRTCL